MGIVARHDGGLDLPREHTGAVLSIPTPNTGGKSAFTQQAHGEFIVSSETKFPPNTQQAHGVYFQKYSPKCLAGTL